MSVDVPPDAQDVFDLMGVGSDGLTALRVAWDYLIGMFGTITVQVWDTLQDIQNIG